MATFPNYKPEYAPNKSVKSNASEQQLGDGYNKRLTWGLNITSRAWSLTFNITELEADEIEEFLYARAEDAEPFEWTPPDSSAVGRWRCDSWNRESFDLDRVRISAEFNQVFEPASIALVPVSTTCPDDNLCAADVEPIPYLWYSAIDSSVPELDYNYDGGSIVSDSSGNSYHVMPYKVASVPAYLLLVKRDIGGEIVWQKSLGKNIFNVSNSFVFIRVDTQGRLVIGAAANDGFYIIKLTTSGSVVFSKKITPNATAFQMYNMRGLEINPVNNSIVVIGGKITDVYHSTHGYLVIISANGDLVAFRRSNAVREYGGSDLNNILHNACFDSLGNIYCVMNYATRDDYWDPATTRSPLLIGKLDKDGNSIGTCRRLGNNLRVSAGGDDLSLFYYRASYITSSNKLRIIAQGGKVFDCNLSTLELETQYSSPWSGNALSLAIYPNLEGTVDVYTREATAPAFPGKQWPAFHSFADGVFRRLAGEEITMQKSFGKWFDSFSYNQGGTNPLFDLAVTCSGRQNNYVPRFWAAGFKPASDFSQVQGTYPVGYDAENYPTSALPAPLTPVTKVTDASTPYLLQEEFSYGSSMTSVSCPVEEVTNITWTYLATPNAYSPL